MGRFLGFYVIALLLALLCEWALNRYAPSLLSGYTGNAPRDFLKDVEAGSAKSAETGATL